MKIYSGRGLARPGGIPHMRDPARASVLFSPIFYNPCRRESMDLGTEFLTVEQRCFFEELLAYLRDELEARKDPEAAEQRARMFAALAGEAGRAEALKDKHLAEEGFVYLAKEGKKYLRCIGELTPLDVPAVMAEMESAAAVGGEYMENDGTVSVIEYGGRKLVTPDPGDPSAPLRARWRDLKVEWPRR
jgi:hypothetical protein